MYKGSKKTTKAVRLAWSTLILAASPCMATVYYVSSSSGDDANDGLDPGSAFATVVQVNSMELQPGDEVRFRCGDTWRAEPLVIRDSGTLALPIVITSDPLDCVNRPILSGSRRIVDWVTDSTDTYRADLGVGGNNGRFPEGIHQLFRGGQRLPMGRWPNLAANQDGGYSTIESQPQGDRIVDLQLPAIDWTGAALHFKSERWYLFNRNVTGTSGTTLILNDTLVCRDGCAGWGYFLNGHQATLDQQDEWHFDADTNRVYLYSSTGPPVDGEIAASILGTGPPEEQSGVVLGGNYPEHVEYVTVKNLEVREWASHGIMMASLLRDDQCKYLTIEDNVVRDVAGVGINMTTWVYGATPAGNGPNGLRGGIGLTVANNLVDGANHHGIETASVDSEFLDNEVRNVGLIENLVRDGLGCPFDDSACGIMGVGIRVKIGNWNQEAYSGSNNLIRHNRIDNVGMNGIDVFGAFNDIERNRIEAACQTLGDCGGIRSFGGDNYGMNGAHDNVVAENIILQTLGNTDGVAPPLEDLWGLGIYIDHFADSTLVSDNTVVGSTGYGIVYDNARGSITSNNLFDNSTGPANVAHLRLQSDDTDADIFDNAVYSLEEDRPILAIKKLSNLGQADNNYYFNPRDPRLVRVQDLAPSPMTLSEWQTLSGEDANTEEAWFVRDSSDPPLATIYINDTKIPLQINLGAQTYFDLDQQEVTGSFQLAPFRSRILIREETSISVFSDSFDSGNTDAWSATLD